MKAQIVKLLLKAIPLIFRELLPYIGKWANQFFQYTMKRWFYRGRYWKHYREKARAEKLLNREIKHTQDGE